MDVDPAEDATAGGGGEKAEDSGAAVTVAAPTPAPSPSPLLRCPPASSPAKSNVSLCKLWESVLFVGVISGSNW